MSCLVVNTFQGLPRKEKKRKAEEAAEEPAAKEVKVVPPQDTQRWVDWSTQIREKHGKSIKRLRISVFQLCFTVYIVFSFVSVFSPGKSEGVQPLCLLECDYVCWCNLG